MYLSRIFHENQQAFKTNTRVIVNRGGARSTKTWSILQLLIDIARKKDYKIDVIGQTVPHLKQGVLTDIPNVCKDFGIIFDNTFNKSDKEFKLKGSINFLSIDKLGKALGGGRDILFLNEANYIPWQIVEQLIIRTRRTIFIDFNPTRKFWLSEQLENIEEDIIEIHSTYKDNKMLAAPIIKSIEARKNDYNFWRIYGLGEYGIAEGLIFNNVEVDCEFDKEAFEHYRHGADWGFSADPFAYNRIAIDKQRMIIYVCDEIHGLGLQNTDTAPMVQSYAKGQTVYCDSAEPKSVQEYRNLGINAIGVKKGQGSVETGIKYMQRYEIKVHSTCPKTADEFLNYSWKRNKMTGEFLNVPEDSFNHHIDAIRYSLNDDLDGFNGIGISFF